MHRTTLRVQEELTMRGYAKGTIEAYGRAVELFAEVHGKAPGDLTAEDAHSYLAHLSCVEDISSSSYNVHASALRFLYGKVLEQPEAVEKIPLRKQRGLTLPVVLSTDEVTRLFAVTKNLKAQTLLMTAYSGGLRVSEVCRLRITDIDSERMRLRIAAGKGGKERHVMLAQNLLPKLRAYWKAERPKIWLFPSPHGDGPLGPRMARTIFKKSKEAAKIHKPATFHSLRHNAESRIMPSKVLKYRESAEILAFGHSALGIIQQVSTGVWGDETGARRGSGDKAVFLAEAVGVVSRFFCVLQNASYAAAKER